MINMISNTYYIKLFGSSAAPRMFVQDLLATNDGGVIKLTDLREVNEEQEENENKHHHRLYIIYLFQTFNFTNSIKSL